MNIDIALIQVFYSALFATGRHKHTRGRRQKKTKFPCFIIVKRSQLLYDYRHSMNEW